MAKKTGNELMADGLGCTNVISLRSCAKAVAPSNPSAGSADSIALNVRLVIISVSPPKVG